MPDDVPHEHLGGRVGRAGGLADVFFGEHEQLIARSTARTRYDAALADDAAQREILHRVQTALRGRVDAALLEHVEEFAASQRVAAAQGSRQHPLHRRELIRAESELAIARRRHAQLPLAGDPENPGEILGGDDVQGSALRPGADQDAAVEQPVDGTQCRRSGRARSERPAARPELLSLYSEHVTRGIGHGGRRCRQSMRAQALGAHGMRFHMFILPAATDTARDRADGWGVWHQFGSGW